MVHYLMEYYAAEKKKALLPCATAWMELETIMLSETSQLVEDKIPYDLTYKRNLMNKQAKKNQRLGNKEQIDSGQRGRGREIMVERRRD